MTFSEIMLFEHFFFHQIIQNYPLAKTVQHLCFKGGEVLCELNENQWSFNVSWCPRNPAVIAASSFDSRVSIYSLMGGQQQVNISKTRTFRVF